MIPREKKRKCGIPEVFLTSIRLIQGSFLIFFCFLFFYLFCKVLFEYLLGNWIATLLYFILWEILLKIIFISVNMAFISNYFQNNKTFQTNTKFVKINKITLIQINKLNK